MLKGVLFFLRERGFGFEANLVNGCVCVFEKRGKYILGMPAQFDTLFGQVVLISKEVCFRSSRLSKVLEDNRGSKDFPIWASVNDRGGGKKKKQEQKGLNKAT